MHTEHRTWFPFILVGLTFVLIFGVLVWMQSPSGGDVEALQVFAPSSEDYQAEVTDVMSSFAESQDAQVAHDALLNIRVPAEYKDLHFDLALLLLHMASDPELDISDGLVTLQAEYNWLP